MDDFANKLEKDVLITLDRIRKYERNKAIEECLKIVEFYKDNWDGIEWAIREIEEFKESEE